MRRKHNETWYETGKHASHLAQVECMLCHCFVSIFHLKLLKVQSCKSVKPLKLSSENKEYGYHICQNMGITKSYAFLKMIFVFSCKLTLKHGFVSEQ